MAKKNAVTSIAKNVAASMAKNNSITNKVLNSATKNNAVMNLATSVAANLTKKNNKVSGIAEPSSKNKVSGTAQSIVAPVQQEFKPSDTTQSYLNQLKKVEGNAPGGYTSKYQSQIDELLSRINNREKFSYDFNADPLYQQYKDSYTKLGKEAGMNAAANAANLTGGYGNSYAATAAAQANQQYLTQLNDVIPELYNAAIDKYQMEGQDMLSQYGAMSEAEQAAYNQYRDSMSDYYNNLSYYQNAYNSSLGNDWNLANFKYQQARDQVSDQQWKDQFEENVRQFGLNYALQKASQELAEREYNTSKDQWQQQFDYSKTRDQVSDQQWKDQFDYSKERDLVSDSQWKQQFDYNKSRDQVSDSQWQKQFNYNKQQDAISNALAKANANASTTADDSSNTADTVNEVARIRDLGLGDIVDFAMSQAQWGKMGGNNDPVYDYLYTQYEKGKISDTELEAIYNYVKMQRGK